MKYCPSCGNQIDDNAGFCPQCGNRQAVAPDSRATMRGKRLHCPKCKDFRLSPIVETDIKGGTSINMPVVGRFGVSDTYMRSTHRNFWMCQSCGHKFRQLEDLRNDLAKRQKASIGALICIIPLVIIALLDMISGGPILHILMIPLILFCGALFFINKVQSTKLSAEKDYLSKKCFD